MCRPRRNVSQIHAMNYTRAIYGEDDLLKKNAEANMGERGIAPESSTDERKSCGDMGGETCSNSSLTVLSNCPLFMWSEMIVFLSHFTYLGQCSVPLWSLCPVRCT